MGKVIDYSVYFDNTDTPATPDEVLASKTTYTNKIVAILAKSLGKEDGIFCKKVKQDRNGDDYDYFYATKAGSNLLLEETMQLFGEE